MDFENITFGSIINIISKSNIRYQGVFDSCDETTLMLSKVKSYGTEDRKAPQKIEPQDKIYKFIRFKGVDIAEIYIEKMADNEFIDPAILTAEIMDENETNNLPSNDTKKSTKKDKHYKQQQQQHKIQKSNDVDNQPSTTTKPITTVSSIATNKHFNNENHKLCPINNHTATMIIDDNKGCDDDASSDMCAQYNFKEKKPPKKTNISEMEVKEFDFNSAMESFTQNQSTINVLEYSAIEKLDSYNKKKMFYTPLKNDQNTNESSYNANSSFFDKLSYDKVKFNGANFRSRGGDGINNQYNRTNKKHKDGNSYKSGHQNRDQIIIQSFPDNKLKQSSNTKNNHQTSGKSAPKGFTRC